MTNLTTHNSVPAADSPLSAASGLPRSSPMPVLMCGTFMIVLDFFIVNVALPSIQSRPRGALYPAEVFEQEVGQMVAFVPVAAEVTATGRAAMTKIPAAELAVAVHHSPFGDLDQTYAALGTYVAEREIGVDAPIREPYLVTPFDTSDESQYVTEVCWPVFRTPPAG